jgi:hypothetical protein
VRGEATRRAIRGTWAMSVPMERAGKGNGRRRGGGIGGVERSVVLNEQRWTGAQVLLIALDQIVRDPNPTTIFQL